MTNRFGFRFLLTCVALFGATAGLYAQATRTWVSGVGDDANPCSRTAPCKTFAGAISKTAEGGEIDVLDPGGFGVVTITKAITLDGTHGAGFGSILNSSVNGVNINITGGTHINDAVVILRSLSIQGASQATSPGVRGISLTRCDRVYVYDCHIQNQSTAGIAQSLSATGSLFVQDTDFTNTGTAISTTTTAGTALLQANRISAHGNSSGVVLNALSQGMITESFFGRNIGGSAAQAGNGSTLDISHSKFISNTIAINAVAGSTIRVNECEIFENSNGFTGNAASIQSGGNNKVVGNTSSLTPAGPPIPTQ